MADLSGLGQIAIPLFIKRVKSEDAVDTGAVDDSVENTGVALASGLRQRCLEAPGILARANALDRIELWTRVVGSAADGVDAAVARDDKGVGARDI